MPAFGANLRGNCRIVLEPHPGARSDDPQTHRPQEPPRVPRYRLLLRGRRPSECFVEQNARRPVKPG